mgnify:CR=1 FL=1
MFKIYNASAGSGKTYTLVKDYLKIILTSEDYLPHRHILAITFTNKAVEVMKRRILDTLMRFSKPSILQSNDTLFLELSKELKFSSKALHHKSQVLIHKILHNYGSFEVSTIDKFNQKLIRTFAYDLELPMNFEVELDKDSLLKQAVDRLIHKAGDDRELTKVLVQYALSKTDDDKSWDIALDLNQIAQLLTKETAQPFLNALSSQDLEDFRRLSSAIEKEQNLLSNQIIRAATEVLEKFRANGLEFSDFNRGSIPKYFLALTSKQMDVRLDAAWQLNIRTTPFYTQKTPLQAKEKIDSIRHFVTTAFETTRKALYRLKYLRNIQQNATPLSVLTLIQKELNTLKKEQNIILISEFNSLIGKEIKSQPTPFIYERIGEKFEHYFVDEFQDTSEMQWNNLTPLMVNALASAKGSVSLVGDPKQAIYRWRGGHPEQFIDLINNTSAFPAQAKVFDLPVNYRSCEKIVAFNNAFFEHVSQVLFTNKAHRKIYQSAPQNPFISKPGYVQLNFLLLQKGDDKDLRYAQQVFETISNYMAASKKANFKHICVLVRKQKEGVVVADYLTAKNIPIISNQSLLVSSSKEVQFIVAVFKYILDPTDAMSQLQLLNYLIDQQGIQAGHQFRLKHLHSRPDLFFKALRSFGIQFNEQEALSQPIYDAAEMVVNAFDLVSTSDAYVQFFLDFIFEYTLKNTSSLPQFLEHYEQKKENLSIVYPSGVEAVQIMTVHKSKGLEFPVVIFPYAALNVYKEINPKEWMPTSHLDPNFPHFLMNYSKDFEHFNAASKARYVVHQSKLELDNINLLYVALTRASDQLYIIGEAPSKAQKPDSLRTYSDLLVGFLKAEKKWRPGVLEYSFGKLEGPCAEIPLKFHTRVPRKFISTSTNDRNISVATKADYMWDSQVREAIEKGNLIHYLLSKVYTQKDIPIAIQEATTQGLITKQQGQKLTKVLKSIAKHPKLVRYYSDEVTAYNEREIMTEKGKTIIPDRLVKQKNGSIVILDYKTGRFSPKYQQQLDNYAATVQQMSYHVEKKILVFIYPEVSIKILE